jgi:hypothetical protein
MRAQRSPLVFIASAAVVGIAALALAATATPGNAKITLSCLDRELVRPGGCLS